MRVGKPGSARSSIPNMSDGNRARKILLLEFFFQMRYIPDALLMPHSFAKRAIFIPDRNSRTFLTAVLKAKQTQKRHFGGVFSTAKTEYSAHIPSFLHRFLM